MLTTAEAPAATVDTLTNGEAATLNAQLERNGKVHVARGISIVRPVRDESKPEPLPDPDATTGLITADERVALRKAFEPLGSVEQEQRDSDGQAIAARAKGDGHKLADIATHADVLKRDHAQLRGTARMACLAALDAASKRAASQYTAAAAMLADAAGAYVGLATLRDDLVGGRAQFDPLGLWHTAPMLLAPDLAHRPRGWCVVNDCFGRETLWHGSSAGHLDAVRRTQQAFRDELQPVLAGARWPF